MPYELFDSHCHLDAEALAADLEGVIGRAKTAGVTRIVTIGAGYGIESANRAVQIAESHPLIWASVGVHPHDAAKEFSSDRLVELARSPRVVAIGETGLDYHYDFATPEQQISVFNQQIELAVALDKPLIIHCRKAAEECLKILTESNARRVGGIFHCYSEDGAFAAKLKKINFIVSFPGILTFKKSEGVREAAAAIPLEDILLETDAPFLAPEPHRGKVCESSMMVKTALKLAEVHGKTLEEVATITTDNALRFFKLTRSST